MGLLDIFRPSPTAADVAEIKASLARVETKLAQIPTLVAASADLKQGQQRVEEAIAQSLSLGAALQTGQSTQSTQLTTIERMVTELMSKATELIEAQANTAREVQETKDYVKGIKTSLDESLKRIEDLIQQDAEDAELRAAVDTVLPKMREDVDNLDKIQHPETEVPPVVTPIATGESTVTPAQPVEDDDDDE